MPNPTPSPTIGFDSGATTSQVGVSGTPGSQDFYNPDPQAPSVDEMGSARVPDGFLAQVRYAYAANGISPDPNTLADVASRLWEDQNYQIRYTMGGQQLPEQNQSELGRDLFSSKSRFPDIAYQSIAQMPQENWTSAQADFMAAGGDPAATKENLLTQVTGGNGGANSIQSIIVDEAQKAAKAHGLNADQTSQLAALAIATAFTESGLNPNAVGDNGHSVGLFQLHDQGMGYGMGDSRYDARTNAAKALDSMAATWAANPNLTPGAIAAASQRPADAAGYASIVDAEFQKIRGGQLPSASTTAAKFAGPAYAAAQSLYSTYFGQPADSSTLAAIVGSGTDKQQMDDYVRSLGSHIPGMTIGQYTDVRKEADAVAQPLFGHQVTDGIVKELFDSGQTAPVQIKRFMNFLNPNLDPAVYNAIAPNVVAYHNNVANDPGADPRMVGAIAAQGGATTLPNSQAAATADAQPVDPNSQHQVRLPDGTLYTVPANPGGPVVMPYDPSQPDQKHGGGAGDFTP